MEEKIVGIEVVIIIIITIEEMIVKRMKIKYLKITKKCAVLKHV
jgi:hypothetical protein